MWSFIWHTFFFDPIYNGLIFFIDTVPYGDVGLAVIAITIVVKALLFPLSIKAAKTQKAMKQIEPKIKEIKETITDSQEKARATMALYKDSGINPFASILVMFIQIPFLFALYLSVYKCGGVPLPGINTGLLYPFISNPEVITMLFVGSIDITQKSLLLAVLAGVFQFIQGYLAFPPLPPKKEGEIPSIKDEFARSLQVQMKFVLPFVIGFLAYSLSAIIALCFLVSSIAAVIQWLLIRKHKV